MKKWNSSESIHRSEGTDAFSDEQKLEDHVHDQLVKYWKDAGNEGYIDTIDFDDLYQEAMGQYNESGLQGVTLDDLHAFCDGPVMLMAKGIDDACLADILEGVDLAGFTTI